MIVWYFRSGSFTHVQYHVIQYKKIGLRPIAFVMGLNLGSNINKHEQLKHALQSCEHSPVSNPHSDRTISEAAHEKTHKDTDNFLSR
jgi:hypothetical protein